MSSNTLKIGITCYPSVGGSGILATALGEELARRGNEVHFISYERPFRLSQGDESQGEPRVHFHPVEVSAYGLFKYPDYTLPLSVKMAEVSRDYELDILHVHYAVPHATAAILARSMLPRAQGPKVITTLHGTDTTLLAHDPNYGPAIRHALCQSDAITAVSQYLRGETHRLLGDDLDIEVIHNFFVPRQPRRSREEVRRELGVSESEALVIHSSNLRPVKRIDLLLEATSRIRPREGFKLLILAGDDFAPFANEVRRLGLQERVVVREKVLDVEEYVQAADLGLVTSQSESFCLSILEAMFFERPSVSTRVGGIPEVIDHNRTGVLVPLDEPDQLASEVGKLIRDPARRAAMGAAARRFAQERFCADAIVPLYEALYRRALAQESAPRAD
jgi:N-acetyl-alpha-D-glucosaminyl L-malate synthase BshA